MTSSQQNANGKLPLRERWWVAVRFLILSGVAIAAIGVAGHYVAWPFLTTALGPTAYVFVAHPNSSTGKLRNAVIGHGVAIASGLFALAVFGLWNHPATTSIGHSTLLQDGAAGLAVGLTLLGLELLGAHHAPAGSTALLVATGISRPGQPLYGLIVGLVGLFVLAPLLAQIPFRREAAAREKD